MNLLEAFYVEMAVAGGVLGATVVYLTAARVLVALGPRLLQKRVERELAELVLLRESAEEDRSHET